MNLEHDSNSEDIVEYNELLRSKSDSARDAIDYKSQYFTLLDKYNELIYAVQSKHPNETRHQTALRYVLEREKLSEEPQSQKVVTPWNDPTFQKREWNVTPIVPEPNK